MKGLPLRLYFQDEARFGRMNKVQKCWCRKGVAPAVPQQLIRRYTYAFSAACPETGRMYSLIMPSSNAVAMNIFVKGLSEERKDERIILCMDNAAWHTTDKLEVPDNVVLWFLPPYSPELNPVELIWRELRAKYFNNKAFGSMKEVEDHLEFALKDFAKDGEAVKRLTKINYL